ncbi:Peptidase dimerisation domain-containing protein [Bhargavaea ginsengi]|uniref:Peptidase dimerisation domain-containing protein n=1 Tax=Bhargavaea ginsengi TaxID=426757 RepID=A0A1H6UX42_9BACL|nr:amidohydrolase [Bhargavaea ginsengi]SEI96993.1 Peptidase dimerisation domain-containing protein [Bhargavaea ginsengi]
MNQPLYERFSQLQEELVAIRRDLHMHPEVGHTEERTPAFVAEYLRNLGIEVRTGVGGRGVVGTLKGGKPGKTVALRADFDALPIQDEKEVPYKSTVPGVMHACGHDLHTATLLGVAKVLSEVRDELSGTVVFLHQHAEETTPGGADFMIQDGCLDGVDVIYGAHVMADEPLGSVGVMEGYASSAQDDFEIAILGKGGHGAAPHTTIDPLVTGSQLVVNFQQILSRRVNPMRSGVITVGSFQSGDATNVIPDKAVLKGTVRTYDPEVRDLIEEAMERLTRTTCEGNGATYEFHYVRDCPSIYNDAEETKRVAKVAASIFGAENVRYVEPMSGSEDFAYYTEHVKASYFIVGGGNPEIGADFPHHHPKFNVDERSIQYIGKTFIGAVLDFLGDTAAEEKTTEIHA